MFYIYEFYYAEKSFISWHLQSPTRRFTSSQHCEIYLREQGHSLASICQNFCIRWFPYDPPQIHYEVKSEFLYPGQKATRRLIYGR